MTKVTFIVAYKVNLVRLNNTYCDLWRLNDKYIIVKLYDVLLTNILMIIYLY